MTACHVRPTEAHPPLLPPPPPRTRLGLGAKPAALTQARQVGGNVAQGLGKSLLKSRKRGRDDDEVPPTPDKDYESDDENDLVKIMKKSLGIQLNL